MKVTDEMARRLVECVDDVVTDYDARKALEYVLASVPDLPFDSAVPAL